MMKRLFTWLACAALTLSLGACSDDDDARIDEELLIGSWKMTAVYDGEYDRWEYDVSEDLLLLNADGTGSEGTNAYDRFTWYCEGNVLVLDFGGGEITRGIVAELSATELVISSGEYRGEDGGTYEDRTCYERVTQ